MAGGRHVGHQDRAFSVSARSSVGQRFSGAAQACIYLGDPFVGLLLIINNCEHITSQ